jgi:chromosome segregation ATPase
MGKAVHEAEAKAAAAEAAAAKALAERRKLSDELATLTTSLNRLERERNAAQSAGDSAAQTTAAHALEVEQLKRQAATLVDKYEQEEGAHTVTRAEREELKRRLEATVPEMRSLSDRNEALMGTVEQQARELQGLQAQLKDHEDRCACGAAVRVWTKVCMRDVKWWGVCRSVR